MDKADLCWRIEEACFAAWPSPKQLMLDGWLLRTSGGPTRRTNSANPLRNTGDCEGLRAKVEAVYGALGQPAIFRLPSFTEGMDGVLARAGYTAEGGTATLFCDLTDTRLPAAPVQDLPAQPDDEWRQARARLNGAGPAESRIYEAMLEAILVPRRFAAVREAGEIVSIAYGVLHNGLLVVESVATDPGKRQRGYATQAVGKLMAWADAEGIQGACLQVVADNAAARGLYRKLGFAAELYRYHYRRQAAA